MSTLNNYVCNIMGISPEIMLVVLGFLLYYFHFFSEKYFIITSIIITSFVLAIYDVVLKNILLFRVDNEYYKFVLNNVITIVVIDFLIKFITDMSHPNLNAVYYFNLAFACIFYETIIFKLYNYNNLCNKRLRSVTKTILRLATIHILSNFLNGKDYGETWFDFSFGQIFNFALFDTVFSEN
jgi:FlaA1/EpsC-like NDP-sugar epimerase